MTDANNFEVSTFLVFEEADTELKIENWMLKEELFHQCSKLNNHWSWKPGWYLKTSGRLKGFHTMLHKKNNSKIKRHENRKRKRRLYRDPQETVLGGVCGGLAAYFDIDPVIMQINFVVLAFITFGVGLLAYLILWIAVPKALNTAQRFEMRGQEVIVKNIEKFIQEEAEAVKESHNKFRKSDFFTKREKA